MYKENCLICGKPLVYLQGQEEMICSICGESFSSSARCEDGHFVCDGCHEEKGIQSIREVCLAASSKNPIEILQEIMKDPYIYMHGPEHHILVGASLLTAYNNSGGQTDLSASLEEMIRRGRQVPGGACGFWGCCGAAVSSGIFFSLVTETTPLSGGSWGLAQRCTAAALEKISAVGGPRCCKRDSVLAVLAAIDFVKDHLGVAMEGRDMEIRCGFSPRNGECLGRNCPFHPARPAVEKENGL